MADTLLTYAPSTDPSPVGISTSQVTVQARVNVSAAANSGPAYCNQVIVAVPVGTDAPSLFTGTPAGSVSTGKWAVSTQILSGTSLWEGARAAGDQEYAVFTYDCVSANDYLIDYNLVFGALGQVAPAAGPAQVLIRENSGRSSDPSTFTPKQTALGVDKTWPQFTLKNLVATVPSKPTVPATDFASGAPIAFSWESNATWFQLYMKDQTAPVYAGTATTFTLTAGVTRDTTFILAASMTGSPGQDTPQGGYEPVVLYDAVTITIANPALTPSTVAVSGALSVSGQTTLAATSAGAVQAQSANVSGAVQAGSLATAGNLSASGQTTLGATQASGLTVTGGTTLASATVNGGLSAGGTTLGSLNVSGGLTARSGPVAMNGPGVLLKTASGNGQTIPTTAVYAKTDGFALAYVKSNGNNSKSQWGYGQINVNGTWFEVLGGTVGSFGGGWSSQMDANQNGITIPIPANTYWYYAGWTWDGGQEAPPISIYWFPMGGGSSAIEETYELVSAERAAELPAPPPPPTRDPGAFLQAREDAAAEFVARLGRALERDLDDVKAELSELLVRM